MKGISHLQSLPVGTISAMSLKIFVVMGMLFAVSSLDASMNQITSSFTQPHMAEFEKIHLLKSIFPFFPLSLLRVTFGSAYPVAKTTPPPLRPVAEESEESNGSSSSAPRTPLPEVHVRLSGEKSLD